MKRHPFFVDAFFMYKCYQALNKKFDFSQIKFYWLFRILNKYYLGYGILKTEPTLIYLKCDGSRNTPVFTLIKP